MTTSLINAVIRGNSNKVQELLNNGTDPNIPDEFNRIPLHYAVIYNLGL